MATYVLVPGFWLGGWAWQQVTADLRAAGHDVYPVTLTGLGDRVHLAGPEVDLETHVTDIVNVITYADLHDVVLVGHSGGGMPVSIAADRIPERLSRVVYVESGPLPDGMSQFDTNPPQAQEAIRKQVDAEGDGWRLTGMPWDDPATPPMLLAGLGDAEFAVIRSRAVAQPFGTAIRPVHRNGPASVPESLVTCIFPLEQARQMLADRHPMFAGFRSDVQIVELPTGHWPMFSRPSDLAQLLHTHCL
jgi:pimeloyl-ACP methyl ester carboxylesterase